MGTQTLPEAPVKDTFPINGTDYVEFYVGNATQTALYYQHCWGYRLIAYRGPETGTRDRASYCPGAGQDPAGPDHAALPGAPDRSAPSCCTATVSRTSPSGWMTPGTPSRRPSPAAPRASRSRRSSRTRTARSSSPRSAPTATPSTRSSSGRTTAASSCRASSRSSSRIDGAAGRPQVRRSLRRQRRAGQDERLGRVLPATCSASRS